MRLPGYRDSMSLLLAAFALWFAGAFLFVALQSINYPFQLEWMEGQTIDILRRIHEGLPFYTKPSMEYVPYIYTPLYYYVAACIAHFTVLDFFPARLLSIVSTLGTAGIIFAWIRKERGSRSDAVIAAGIFFSTYLLSGRWFDVSRIDNFWMLLVISGLFVLRHYRSAGSAIAAGLLMVAAFFTKQSALILLAPILGATLLTDSKRALICGGVFAAGLVIGIIYLQFASEGWFWFYVFDVPAGHGLENRAVWGYWSRDIGIKLLVAIAFSLSALVFIRKENTQKALWYAVFLLSFVMGSYVSRLHWGGWLNVLIPLHVALALMTGLSLQYWRAQKGPVMVAAMLLLLVHFAGVLYNPIPLIPTQEAAEKGRHFLEEIAHIDGDIFMSEIQFVQTRVGKKSFTYGMAGFDVMRSELGDKNYIKDELEREVQEAFRTHRFAAVISSRFLKMREKDPYYTFDRAIDYPKEYITGALPHSTTDLYLPNPDQP